MGHGIEARLDTMGLECIEVCLFHSAHQDSLLPSFLRQRNRRSMESFCRENTPLVCGVSGDNFCQGVTLLVLLPG